MTGQLTQPPVMPSTRDGAPGHLGVDSLVGAVTDRPAGHAVGGHLRFGLVQSGSLSADQAGSAPVGVGDQRRADRLDAGSAVLLSAATPLTAMIRLRNAVTGRCAAIPLRVLREFRASCRSSGRRAEVDPGLVDSGLGRPGTAQ